MSFLSFFKQLFCKKNKKAEGKNGYGNIDHEFEVCRKNSIQRAVYILDSMKPGIIKLYGFPEKIIIEGIELTNYQEHHLPKSHFDPRRDIVFFKDVLFISGHIVKYSDIKLVNQYKTYGQMRCYGPNRIEKIMLGEQKEFLQIYYQNTTDIEMSSVSINTNVFDCSYFRIQIPFHKNIKDYLEKKRIDNDETVKTIADSFINAIVENYHSIPKLSSIIDPDTYITWRKELENEEIIKGLMTENK